MADIVEENALETLNLPILTRTEIARWLKSPRYADERPALEALVRGALAGDDGATSELRDAFDGPLPIGTGGRRGPCGPGTHRMNRTILRETAQGLADAMAAEGVRPHVAIVYDTRRDSRLFAYVVAAQLAANEIDVLLVDAPRATPQLSFLIDARELGAGVVISASHNPPRDNGIKIYGANGAQVLGDRDRALMAAIQRAATRPLPQAAPNSPRIEVVGPGPGLEALDRQYVAFVRAQEVMGDLGVSKLRVVYSPLHGVGHTLLLPLLRAKGVEVSMVAAQAPDQGEFATVRSANPEVPETFALAREQAERETSDLVIANDPDADRLGALLRDPAGRLQFVDGNRLGVLMLRHVLRNATIPADGWILSTMVTTPLIGKLARAADVCVVDDLLVGFKHHGGMMAEAPSRPVVFATEESNGYLRGNAVRDKDGAVAALLLCEAAARAKAEGTNLFDDLQAAWDQHGYHRERTAGLYAYGAAGREAIAQLVKSWRGDPPQQFAGHAVRSVEDRNQSRDTDSPTRNLPGDVLSFELEPPSGGHLTLVVRPSGTEPKAKLYVLAAGAPAEPGRTLSAGQCDEIDRLVAEVLDSARALADATMRPWLSDA